MEKENLTVGYTDSADFRCLEDLQDAGNMGSVNLIILDYCGRERCKSGYAFGPFVRENYVLHIVAEGKGQLRRDGKTWDVEKNQAFLLRPGQETVYQADLADPWIYSWIGFHGYLSEKLIQSMGFTREQDVIRVKDAALLTGYIDAMMDHRELTFAHHLKRSAYLELLLGEIIGSCEAPEKEKSFSEERYVNLAAEYILEHYAEPVRISDIAGRIGVNRSYLASLFKKEMGVSPQEFLISFRLRKAAELLSETDLPVRAVSSMVGYPDSMTFSKAFKQKYGMNPSHFRVNSPVLALQDMKGTYTGNYKL